MGKTNKEERIERHQAFVRYLEITYGYVGTTRGDTNAFCKDLYEIGQVDAPERLEGGKPRSAPLLEYLTGKFRANGFTWQRGENGAIVLSNVPRLAGRQLALYEMLVVPIELCDPPNLDLRRRHKPVSRRSGRTAPADQSSPSGGWAFNDQN